MELSSINLILVGVEDNFKFKGRRRILALELEKKGITNNKILDSIKNIPRHLFVDPGLSEQAYLDKALPIENNQTISQPFTVALQTQLLDLNEGYKVLEIGTIPVLLTSPIVGLSPTIEFKEEGERIDPDVSDPSATDDKLAEIATPLPELEPPDSNSFLP